MSRVYLVQTLYIAYMLAIVSGSFVQYVGLVYMCMSWGRDEYAKSPIKHDALTQCWYNVEPASQTLVQQCTNIVSVYRADWGCYVCTVK